MIQHQNEVIKKTYDERKAIEDGKSTGDLRRAKADWARAQAAKANLVAAQQAGLPQQPKK